MKVTVDDEVVAGQEQATPPAAEAKADEKGKKAAPAKPEQPVVSKEVRDAHTAFDEQIDEEENKPKANKTEGEEQEAAPGEDKNKEGDEEKPPAKEAKAEEQSGGKKPAEQKAKLSPELLTRAAKAGLNLSQAMAFTSPEDLEGALAIFEAKVKPDAKPAGKDDKKEGEEEQPEKFDCGLNPDEYDSGIIKSMNAMGQKMLDRINALTKELKTEKVKGASGGASNDAAVVMAHTTWLDSKFAGLGAEVEELFGKGSFDDIKQDSEAFKNRAAVDREVLAIATGYKATGQTPPPKDKIFERAVNNLFGDKIKAAKESKTKGKLGKRAAQAIGPGSQAANSEENEALKAQQEFDSKIDEE